MRKKLTREELETRYHEKAKEAHQYFMAFQSAMSRDYDAITPELKETDGQGTYKFYLIRSTSPDTAYILKRFRHPGQKDYSTITAFGEFFNTYWWQSWPQEWHSALEQFRAEYNRLNYEADLAHNQLTA